MTPAELERLIVALRRLGCGHRTCEVKKARGGLPGPLWESSSALANAQGGHILLGVDEKRDFLIVGVDDAAAIERQLGELCSEMEPPIQAEISTVTIDGAHVVTTYIPPVPRNQRPCFKRKLGPYAGSRVRVADGDRRLTDYEVSLLLANRHGVQHDAMPVPDASLADLDRELINTYLQRVRSSQSRLFREAGDEQVLTTLRVLAPADDRPPAPTLAGLLAFGRYPQTYEPQLNVTVVAYPTPVAGAPGPSGERFLENRSINGPIPEMVAECLAVVRRNMKRRSIMDGIYRVDLWEYPEAAVREALVNALIHRDYSEQGRGAQVQVEMFPDRLVIRNAGNLCGAVDIATLGRDQLSFSRNKTLLKILEDTAGDDGHMLCENRGSGIARILLSLAEAGMEPPRFTDTIATFTAEFPNHTLFDQGALQWLRRLDGLSFTRTQMAALVRMRGGGSATNASYRQWTGLQDSRAATRELRELVDRGILEQYGCRGQATYRLRVTRESISMPLLDVEAAKPPAADSETAATDAAPRRADGLSPLQSHVLDALAARPLSRREIEQTTGLTLSQVMGALRALRQKGRAEMVGSPRSPHVRWRSVE